MNQNGPRDKCGIIWLYYVLEYYIDALQRRNTEIKPLQILPYFQMAAGSHFKACKQQTLISKIPLNRIKLFSFFRKTVTDQTIMLHYLISKPDTRCIEIEHLKILIKYK